MEDNNRPKCVECRYFSPMKPNAGNIKGGDGGLCLRFPPTVFMLPTANGQVMVQAQLPPVANNHVCGEFGPINQFAPVTPFNQ